MDRQTDREQWFYRTLSVGQGSKKSNLKESATLFEREQNNRKLNPFIKTMVYRSNIQYSKINQERK